MKKIPSLLLCSLLALAAGCATQVGSVKMPEPTATFAPKQTYAVSSDKLWDAIMNALDKNRIATTSVDKASGTIQTDYIEGPSALIGGGFIAAQSTRYRYNISLRSQQGGDIKLNIFCKLESTMKGSSGASQWSDVSSQNVEGVKKAERWLYEEIEKGL